MDKASDIENLTNPLIPSVIEEQENVPTEYTEVPNEEPEHPIQNPVIEKPDEKVAVQEPLVEPPQNVVESQQNVVESPQNVLATQPNQTLVQLDNLLLALIPNSSSISCKLTPYEIAFMTNLMKDASGGIVPQIQKTIQDILNEGSISLHDIPQLVLLITQIFQSNISVKNINILNLIQYTLDSLLESNILPIPPQLQSVAKNIVDTSISLLNTSLPAVEAKCWSIFSLFSSCFTYFYI